MEVDVDIRHRIGDLEVAAAFRTGGGITALFGRSGAGKTTIVNLMAGLLRPRAGRIRVGDRVLFDSDAGIDLPPHRRRVGYVFQEARLFPHLDVRQNLLYGAWFARRRRDGAAFDGVIAMLGIGHLLGRRVPLLSGGEKQRVAIGRALLSAPDILLMDEPLAAIDDDRKGEILPYIERLRDEAKMPVIYVSHSVNEVARLAGTVVLLADGRTIASGPTAGILGRLDLLPHTGEDGGGAGVVIDTEISAHEDDHLSVLSSPFGDLRVPQLSLPVRTPVRIRILARDVMIGLTPPADISALNVVPCRVGEVRKEDAGMASLRLEHGGHVLLARITLRSLGRLGLVPGRDVYAIIKSVAFDRSHLSIRPIQAGLPDRG